MKSKFCNNASRSVLTFAVALMAAGAVTAAQAQQAVIYTNDDIYGTFSHTIASGSTGSASTFQWSSAGYYWAGEIRFVNSAGLTQALVTTNSDDVYVLYTAGSGNSILGQTCTVSSSVACITLTGTVQSLLPAINGFNGGSGVCCGVSTVDLTIFDMGLGGALVTNIDGSQTYYLASDLGTTVNPAFEGGTLRFDTAGATYTDAFTFDSSTTNTLDADGNESTLSGSFNGTGALTFSDGVGGGAFILTGTIGDTDAPSLVTNQTQLTVASGATLTAGGIDNAAGATLTVDNGGTVVDDLNNSGTVSNSGSYTADVNNTGAVASLTNTATGDWTGNLLSNTGGASVTNAGTWTGNGDNSATFTNIGTWHGDITNNAGGTVDNQAGATLHGHLNNYGTTTSAGTITSGVENFGGTVTSSGTISSGATIYAGSLTTTGMVNGILTNAATINASGTLNGTVLNGYSSSAAVFNVTGAYAANSTFTNQGAATLNVTGGNFTGLTGLSNTSTAVDGVLISQALSIGGTLGNSGYVRVASGGQLTATTVTNASGGTLTVNSGGAGSGALGNAGTFSNSGAWTGAAGNSGTFNNNAGGTVSGLLTQTAGTTTNGGALNGGATVSGGTFTTTGTVLNGLMSSAAVSASGTVNGAITNLGNGVFTVSGALSGNDTFSNGSAAQLVVSGGAFTGLTGLTNSSTLTDGVLVSSTLNVSGVVANSGTGKIRVASGGQLTATSVTNASGATLTVDASGAANSALSNAGTFSNTGAWTGTASNSGTFNNNAGGTLSGLLTQTAGTTTNAGALNGGATVTGGTFTSTNTVAGGFSNAATASVRGTMNGAIANSGAGTFTVTGALAGNGAFTNSGTAQLIVNGGAFTGLTGLTNTSTLTDGVLVSSTLTIAGTLSNSGKTRVASGGHLNATGITNAAGATLTVDAGGFVVDALNNSGTVSNSGSYTADVNNTGASASLTNTATGTWTGNLLSNTGGATVLNAGQWTGNGSSAANLTNSGTWTGTLSNAGTFTSSGTLTGLLTNTGTASNSGTLGGGVTVTSGTVTSTATINGGATIAAAGTLNARGAVNGNTSNAGAFTLSGALTNNGGTFSNLATGVLTIGGNAYSGLGAVSNAAGGQINIGTSATTGALSATSLSNSGQLRLQNAHTGDTVTLSGAYTGVSGSVITLDANMASNGNLADRVTAASTSGTSAISVQNTGAGKIYFSTPIVLVSATSGTGTFTAATDSQTTAALASVGVVNYRIGKIGATSNWGIIAGVNTTDASSIASDTSAILATLNSSFYLNAHELVGDSKSDKTWSMQAWGRAEHGSNSFELATASSDPNSPGATSRIGMTFDGAQLGASLMRSGEKTKFHLGVMGGWTESNVGPNSRTDRSNVKIPYYGVYGVIKTHGLLADVQAHHDDLKIRPDAVLTTASLKGTADTVSVSLALPHTVGVYTFEPYGSYSYSKVTIDPVTLNGGVGGLEFSSLSSAIARAGVRLTATTKHGDTTLLPYVSLGAAQTVGDESVTTFVPTGGAANVVMSTDRIGTFAQVSAGLTAQWQNGTEAYLQAGARLGKSISGYSVSTGVRFQF